jgi:hypothetical protein
MRAAKANYRPRFRSIKINCINFRSRAAAVRHIWAASYRLWPFPELLGKTIARRRLKCSSHSYPPEAKIQGETYPAWSSVLAPPMGQVTALMNPVQDSLSKPVEGHRSRRLEFPGS